MNGIIEETQLQWTMQGSQFADTVIEDAIKPPIYTRKDEDVEEEELFFEEILGNESRTSLQEPYPWPKMEISWKEYMSLWTLWRHALIIKVLGKSITFKILE